MHANPQILVADNERPLCRLLTNELERHGYTVVTAYTGEQALQKFAQTPFPVLILDSMFESGGIDGLTVRKEIRTQRPETQVIMLTAYASLESAVEALRLGVWDYVRKGPQVLDDITFSVTKAFEAIALGQRTLRLQHELERVQDASGMIGTSPAMQELDRLITRVAVADVNVLIRGETGTGKELVAKAIHARSPRRDQPFVARDCNIPQEVAEALLFGVIGNFPGFHNKEATTGLFELANGSTLFLDEIGDLPLAVQPKLLRAIQEGEICPLGAAHVVQVDVRVLAATHRNLAQAMQEGHFRPDLYHRVNTMTLETIPLRQRQEDIPTLVAHFLARACTRQKRAQLQASAEALEVLCAYDYPGNVRELENLIERAVLLTDGDSIRPDVLPMYRGDNLSPTPLTLLADLTLAEAVDRLEKTYLALQLQHTQGNISQAARRAGIDRKSLRQKLKKHSICWLTDL